MANLILMTLCFAELHVFDITVSVNSVIVVVVVLLFYVHGKHLIQLLKKTFNVTGLMTVPVRRP